MTRRAPRRRVTVLASVLFLTLAGCQERDPEPDAPLPAGPGRTEVTMREYSIEFTPAVVPSGQTVVHVRNLGTVQHRLTVVAMPDDLPPIAEQLVGERRAILAPFASARQRDPGGDASFAVQLEAGSRYALVCFLRTDAGELHARLGMATEFRAQ